MYVVKTNPTIQYKQITYLKKLLKSKEASGACKTLSNLSVMLFLASPSYKNITEVPEGLYSKRIWIKHKANTLKLTLAYSWIRNFVVPY